jgi:two-component system, cell cycle sensor histidine kinase and response regulator CckA
MSTKIKRIRYVDRQLTSAIILGLAALAINSMTNSVLPGPRLSIGNILLFWCAITLTPFHALVSVSIGSIPETLFTGQHFEGLRLIILCTTISQITSKSRDIPAYAVTLGLWIFAFGPCLWLLESAGVRTFTDQKLTLETIVFTGFFEVVLTVIAGTTLISRTLWGAITHKSAQSRLSHILAHCLTLISSISLLIILLITQPDTILINFNLYRGNILDLALIVIICVYLSSLSGWWLAKYIKDNSLLLGSNSILQAGRSLSFSGLASDYWKRHNKIGDIIEDGLSSAEFRRPENSRISPDQGICALNKNGTISFVNRKFKQFTEIKDNEPLGKKLEQINMNSELQDCITALIERTFKIGPSSTELKLNQLPDKLRYFEISSQLSDTFGDSTLVDGPDSIIVIVKDITNRRAIESHLLQGQRLGSLGNIVEGLAHSFNNALTTIAGQASYAKRIAESEKTGTALEEILIATKKAGKLARQLLNFAGSSPGILQEHDLNLLVQTRIDLLKNLVGENIELSYKKTSEQIGITCDPNLIMQVITNLIINAKEAAGSKNGLIEISLSTEHFNDNVTEIIKGSRPGDFARLRIRDSGSGMSPDVLAKACDPLFSTKSNRGNSGLGLSIVYGIVRAHDGFLTIESQPERGTTVSVYFPLRQLRSASEEADKQDRQAKSERQTATTKGKTDNNREAILIVEDDDNVREVVSSMLSTLGYQVSNCSNGPEALEICSSSTFDLILVDMIMPKMSGTELISKLKEDENSAKTLIMTAYGVTKESVDNDTIIIPKPFDIDTLEKAIQDSLGGVS